jgi:multidrug efflux pump subunit AcrB
MISLVLAVTVVPILEVAIIKQPGKNKVKPEKKRITEKIHDAYIKLLDWNFRHAWLTISIGILSIVASLFIIPHLKFRMSPLAERNQFAVEIHLPDGTPLVQTAKVADSMRIILSKDKRVKSITQFTGMSSPRFHITYAPQMPSDNYAQFIVNTGSPGETGAVLDDYTDLYAHHFRNAYIKFKQIDFQHLPSFEFRFYGEDAEELKKAADLLMAKMRKMPELTNIHTDWGEPLPVMDVALNPVASSQVGGSRVIISANIALITNGFSMGSVSENNDNIPIVLKTGEKHGKATLEDLSDTYISTIIPTVSIPLRQIATVTPVWGENSIVRRNGIRTITVTADTKRAVIASRPLAVIRKVIAKEIVPALPKGVTYQIGGEPEYDKENLRTIIYAIIAAFAIIFFFFLFTYGRFGLTLISLFTLMLFMFGAVFGLWISNLTVGITAALGIIGLFGLTVRNAILMFQHAEQRFKIDGLEARDAAYDAGKRRMIPIFLTSAAASVGVVPMIIGGSSFWAPVGIVIFAGGICLLLMTITILPVLYWKVNDKNR